MIPVPMKIIDFNHFQYLFAFCRECHFTAELKQVYKVKRIGIEAAAGHSISIVNLQLKTGKDIRQSLCVFSKSNYDKNVDSFSEMQQG